MAKGFINDSTLTAIADAIRAKNGKTAKMKPSAMAAAITALSGTPDGYGDMISSEFTLSSDHYIVTIPCTATTIPDFLLVVHSDNYQLTTTLNQYYWSECLWVKYADTTQILIGACYYGYSSSWYGDDPTKSYKVSVVDGGLKIMTPSGRKFKSGIPYQVLAGWFE